MPFYNREDFAEFRVREKGPADHRMHNVELETSYKREFCGGEGKEGALMKNLPRGSCYFDREGGKVWRLMIEQKDAAIVLALQYFGHVYEVEVDGVTTTAHHTGKSWRTPEQTDLF